MPKYVLHVDGTDRTIDTDKFDVHYDALRQDNPDLRIKVRDGSGGIGTVPLAFWKEAVESGRFAPYTQDEAIRLSDRTPNAPAGLPLPPDTGNYVERPAEKDGKAEGYTPGVPYDWERYGVRLPEYEPVPELSAEEVEAYKKRLKEGRKVLADKVGAGLLQQVTALTEGQEEVRRESPLLSALSLSGGTLTPAAVPMADVRYRNLASAQNMLRKADELIRQAEINQKEGGTFVENVGRGLRDSALDLTKWDFGFSDLAKTSGIMQTAKKLERGEELSDDERALLDALAISTAVQQYYGRDVGMGYRVGDATWESLSFMKDMALSPFSGAGKALAKYVTRRASEKLAKGIGKKLARKVTKGIGRVTGDVLGSAALAGTIQGGKTVADARERRFGVAEAQMDDQGAIRYSGHEGGEDWGTALGKSFGARTIENFSEMVGNYFGPIGKAVGKSRPVRALKASKVGKMLDRVSTSDWAKAVGDFEQKAQWHGVVGEYGEEAVGTALNALLVGDNKLSDLTDADQQIETFLSVATLGGFFSAVKTAGYRSPAYSARRRTERAASEAARQAASGAAGALGEDWDSWRWSFENASIEEKVEMIRDIKNDEQMTGEQKRAVLEYVSAQTAYEGIRKAEDKREAEGVISPLEAELRETYGMGQQMQEADPQTKGELWQAYEQAKAPFTDEELTRMENILPEVYLAEHPDRAEAIGTYYRAKAAYEGLVDATREEIDRRAKEAAAAVDRTAHPNGQVYTAALKDDPTAPVHIIGGELVLKPDGTVDAEKSGNYLTIRKGDGQTAMVSPKRIAAVEAQDAARLKEATVQTVRQEAARQEAERIEQAAAQNGGRQAEDTPAYQTGDQLSLHIGDGLVTGTVQQPTPEGNFVVRFDGWTEIPGVGAGQAIVFTPEQLDALMQVPETASEPNPAADIPLPVGETDASIRTAPAAGQAETSGARTEADIRIGRSLTEEESNTLIQEMQAKAVPAPTLELTIENWDREFGKNGLVDTPIGTVKMGENQFAKLSRKGREGKFGMVRPTLTEPDIIIEEGSSAPTQRPAERPSSYIFVKTFTGEKGERVYYFTSVTVSRDGQEVVVSNQEKSANRIGNLLKTGSLIWLDSKGKNENQRSVSETQIGESVPLSDSRIVTHADNNSIPLGIHSPSDPQDKNTNSEPRTQEIPRKKDGTPDYAAMEPAAMYEAIAADFGEATAQEEIATQIAIYESEIERLTQNHSKDLNTRLANRLKVKELQDKAAAFREALKRAETSESAQPEEGITQGTVGENGETQAEEGMRQDIPEDIRPVGKGFFGNIYDQFRGRAKEAVEFLLRKKEGEAVGALHHPQVGDIGLVWGKAGTAKSDGYGLSKIAAYHPEVLDDLQGLLDNMSVAKATKNRIHLESETHRAAIRLKWDGVRKTWLLTAFEKETPASFDRTTDVDENPKDLQNDTAPLQNTGVSFANKGTKSLPGSQEGTEETQASEEKTADRPAVDEASQPTEAVDPVRDADAPVEKYRAVGELVNEMNRLSGAKAYAFNDVSELPADLQTWLGPGFEHDGITWLRESYICVPQMRDAEGVRRTYIHEVAGHLNIEYAIRKTADRTALWEAVVDDIGIETLRSWDIPELNEAIEEYETGERPKRELGREAMAYATELNADLPYFTPKEKPLSLTIDLNQRIDPKTIREILNAANRYDNERRPEIIIANPGREGLSRNVHGAVRPAGRRIRTGDDTFLEDTRRDLSRDATTDPSGRDAPGSGMETGSANNSGTISGQVRTGADRNQQKAVPARETVSESRFRKAPDASTAKPTPSSANCSKRESRSPPAKRSPT